MNEQNTKFNTASVIPFKSLLLVKAVQELQIFLHWRNSSKAKKTKTRTPKQSSTECRFAEWSTSIPFTLFVRIFINMASLFTAVVIHADHQSITLAVPETEESLLKRGKKGLKEIGLERPLVT